MSATDPMTFIVIPSLLTLRGAAGLLDPGAAGDEGGPDSCASVRIIVLCFIKT